MKVWRIVGQHRLDAPWTPPPADHRWTTLRSHVTYAATEPGLAVAERMAYLGTVHLLADSVLLEAEYSGTVSDIDKLPKGWDAWPHKAAVRAIGDQWVADGSSGALIVPSVLLPAQNVLLNQMHPEFKLARMRTHGLERFVR